jgi:hypothetical protein
MNDAAIRGLIWNLVVGISQGRFYSIDHESVVVAAKRVQGLLGEFPDGSCTIMVLKDDLVFNNTLFRESGMHGDKPCASTRGSRRSTSAGRERQEIRLLRRYGGHEAPGTTTSGWAS